MEQSEREVYELVDLGYGYCRWCSPRSPARTSRRRRCAGWAWSGSPPSTPGSPRAISSQTGRQAEIVEVKGSVELAPLTGLVEGSSISPPPEPRCGRTVSWCAKRSPTARPG